MDKLAPKLYTLIQRYFAPFTFFFSFNSQHPKSRVFLNKEPMALVALLVVRNPLALTSI